VLSNWWDILIHLINQPILAMVKKILLGLLAILIIIQFFHPERNLSNDDTHDISTKYLVPNDVNYVLDVACKDCHSNSTKYPWYANVQPAGWFLDHHITDGKRHLNFSDFTKSTTARQNHKFEEIIETVEEGEMPLKSYTYLGLHAEAKLTAEQKQLIMNWAQTQMDSLKAQYPADSLVLQRRRRPSAG